MKTNWIIRLREAIEADPRSMRKISIDSGNGENFLQQLFSTGREPGFDRLLSVLKTLGPEASLYVITGMPLTQQDREFLDLSRAMDEELKAEDLRIFRVLQARSNKPEPPHGHAG